MDESKQLRDANGQLLTQYRSDGPLQIPAIEEAIEPAAVAQDEPKGRQDVRRKAPPKPLQIEKPLVQPSRSAIFIAHGMGQQIQFQTLDDVAWGLIQRDLKQRRQQKLPITPEALPKPKAHTIQVGEDRLQRVELTLSDGTGQDKAVDVYEGYWAPLVEGEVALSDVIGFLIRAAWNGVSNGSRPFQRWVFGRFRDFGSKGRTVRHLLVALLVVASLIVMNATIVAVAAARSPLSQRPEWFSDALFADLSTTFNGALLGLLALALPLAIGTDMRRLGLSLGLRRAVTRVSWLGFALALLALIAAGFAIPSLFSRHLRSEGHSGELWIEWFGDVVERFNAGFETALLICLAVLLVLALIWLMGAVFKRGKDAAVMTEDKKSVGSKRDKPILLVGCLLFLLLLAVCWLFSAYLTGLFGQGSMRTFRRGVSWPLLVAASVALRRLLVQYPGDVAAYISPHTLDRFNELRKEIKECVRRQVHAVYALREHGRLVYDKVYVVGHSLGSVVVYDALNQMIVQDEMTKREILGGSSDARSRLLHVLERTKLLLTFGSPLDKTAFLFALQGGQTSETREALASEVQPLIQNPAFRSFPWVNLYSPQDIISGELDFYDPPPSFAGSWKPIVERAEVQAWTEKRGGFPAKIKGADLNREPLQLRLGFQGAKEPLEKIDWREFFAAFDLAYLALIHPSEDDPSDTRHEFTSRHRIINRPDPEATTLLVAHTEYWRNPLLFDELHQRLVS